MIGSVWDGGDFCSVGIIVNGLIGVTGEGAIGIGIVF